MMKTEDDKTQIVRFEPYKGVKKDAEINDLFYVPKKTEYAINEI